MDRLSMLEKVAYQKALSSLEDDDEEKEAVAEAIYDKIREGYLKYRSDLLDSIDKARASKAVSN